MKPPLTKAQKRIAIAKDVLKQLEAGNYDPNYGGFVSSWAFQNLMVTQDSIKKLTPSMRCGVCAIGAALVSKTKLFNGGEYRSGDGRESIQDLLAPIFSKKQTQEIEAAFEGTVSRVSVYNFYKRNRRFSRGRRMKEIFKNIVANHGTFKP